MVPTRTLSALLAVLPIAVGCSLVVGDGDYAVGDAGPEAPSCGATDQACCADSPACEGSLVCRDGTCQSAPNDGTGNPCSTYTECVTSICVPTGAGSGSVCSSQCTAADACVAGWTCGGGDCQCAHAPEICNGLDDDCNGIVDDPSPANKYCATLIPGTVCADGTCECPKCGGSTCVNMNTDPNNCGACGGHCGSGLVCSMGMCTVTCAPQLTQCAASCVDLRSDVDDCGQCGHPCSPGQVCTGSACVAPPDGG